MDSLDRQVLEQARDWVRNGRKVWVVTVIETWGSAPRPPGALLALRDDGLVVGSVSGGCVEDDLIERVRTGERVGRPSLIHYGVSRDEAARFGLPCGGNLRLVQEPLLDTGWIDDILVRITEIFQTIPSFIFLVVLVAIAQPSVEAITLSIGLVTWPTIARLVRLMTERRQQTKRLGYEVGNGRRS